MALAGVEARRAERLRALGVRESAIEASAATSPLAKKRSDSQIRVFQWNVLADGLADDGFLVADVLSDWPVGEGLLPDSNGGSADLVALAKELVGAHSLPPERRAAKLKELKERFNTPAARANFGAVLDWRARAARMEAEIVAADPDVVALQELDHFEELARCLSKQGYECGMPGALGKYAPAHSANIPPGDADAYLRHLQSVGVAFAPSLPSTARKMAVKWGVASADDSGVALFWKRDRFTLTRLEYLTYAASAKTGKLKGALKAVLARGGEEFHVITAHCASGSSPEEEKARVIGDVLGIAHVMTSDATPPTACAGIREWLATSAAKAYTILAFDANTAPEMALSLGNSALTVWSVLHSLEGVASVWDSWYSPQGAIRPGAQLPVPVTTNKLRGPLSGQYRKAGLHAYSLIDHVYFGSSRLRLVGHVRPPLAYTSVATALGGLLPSLANPSDHVPVVVDLDKVLRPRCASGGKMPSKRPRVFEMSLEEVAPMGA
mmetsp:Transcript_140446/g.436697  ORF Transcript_140446/g.436697 Transcript_140446/m.436697 type:complete len:496 (-) Transcript_140446:168-1655(-)